MKEKFIAVRNGLKTNVGTTDRILSLIAGSVLIFDAVANRKSIMEALAGGYLLFRGGTGFCLAYKTLGTDTLEHNIRNINIKSSITVNKPRDEVYTFWRKLDNLPLFMKQLKSIKILDDKTSEWKAAIPGGLGSIKWKSEIVEDEPGDRIGWRSLPGSMIENAGNVHFRDAGKFGTEVHAVISYRAPAGKAGEGLGKLLNPVFSKIVKEDIRNFRRYMESGELPGIKGQSSGRKRIKA
jgi:uncharacterized membrane protein